MYWLNRLYIYFVAFLIFVNIASIHNVCKLSPISFALIFKLVDQSVSSLIFRLTFEWFHLNLHTYLTNKKALAVFVHYEARKKAGRDESTKKPKEVGRKTTLDYFFLT